MNEREKLLAYMDKHIQTAHDIALKMWDRRYGNPGCDRSFKNDEAIFDHYYPATGKMFNFKAKHKWMCDILMKSDVVNHRLIENSLLGFGY